MEKFVAEGFERGVFMDAGGLKSSKDGIRVRSRGGKLTVTDGPFSEAKEVVGGYALVEVNSKEEAVDLARQMMEIHRVHWPEVDAVCEVRQLDTG